MRLLNLPICVAVAAVSGAVGTLGFGPLEISAGVAAAIAGLFVVAVQARTVRTACLAAFVWGVAYAAGGLWWLYDSMAVSGGLSPVLAAGGVILLGCVIALFPTAVVALVCLLIQTGFASRTTAYALWLPVLFTLSELIRGAWVTDFGWLSVGYAFLGVMFDAWAPVMGVYAVTFSVVLAVGITLAVLLVKDQQSMIVRAGITVCLAALGVTTALMNEVSWSAPAEVVQVRVVQPDLPVTLRATMKLQDDYLARLSGMSTGAALGDRLDLIVWPESAFIIPMQRLSEKYRRIPLEVSAKTGAQVLFNAFNEPEPRKFYNSLWLADSYEKRTAPIYGKNHLVPFGEYVPFGFRWFVDLLGIPMADQMRGGIPAGGIELGGKSVALALCYDSLFGDEMRGWWEKNNPELIISTANLGWFGKNAPVQFLQVNRMRAREFARPLILAMNNAGSAQICPEADVERYTGVTSGAQNFDLSVRTYRGEKTPYARYGELPLALILAILALCAALPRVVAGRASKMLMKKKI